MQFAFGPTPSISVLRPCSCSSCRSLPNAYHTSFAWTAAPSSLTSYFPCDDMDRAVAFAKLMISIRVNSVSGVEQALAAGASVDGVDRPPETNRFPPVVLAASLGHVDIIKLLVRRGADLERALCGFSAGEGVTGWTTPVRPQRTRALHAAVYGGKVEAVRVLLEAAANPNSTDADGTTPLMASCTGDGAGPFCTAQQRFEIVHAMLNAGADAAVTNQNGALAIHCAAAIGATRAIEILLTTAPSTINVKDNNGCTSLGIASFWGHASTVSFLLSAGAHEPAPWIAGFRNGALMLAVERNRQNVVRILLDQGLAAVGGLLVVTQAMRSAIHQEFIGILQLLLDVQGEENRGLWANYRVFCFSESEFAVETQPDRANLVRAGRYCCPTLQLAAGYCSLRAVHVLLSAGADETAVDSQGHRASDLVGNVRGIVCECDPANVSGLHRMLRRAPAFRARSWAWQAGTDPAVGAAPGTTWTVASSSLRVPVVVRILRAKGRGLSSSWYARYEKPVAAWRKKINT